MTKKEMEKTFGLGSEYGTVDKALKDRYPEIYEAGLLNFACYVTEIKAKKGEIVTLARKEMEENYRFMLNSLYKNLGEFFRAHPETGM